MHLARRGGVGSSNREWAASEEASEEDAVAAGVAGITAGASGASEAVLALEAAQAAVQQHLQVILHTTYCLLLATSTRVVSSSLGCHPPARATALPQCREATCPRGTLVASSKATYPCS